MYNLYVKFWDKIPQNMFSVYRNLYLWQKWCDSMLDRMVRWVQLVQNSSLYNWRIFWMCPWKLYQTIYMYMWNWMVGKIEIWSIKKSFKITLLRTGRFCDQCMTTPGCLNGFCSGSFECICKQGWEGMLCDKRNSSICQTLK